MMEAGSDPPATTTTNSEGTRSPPPPITIGTRPESVFAVPCQIGVRCDECGKRFARAIDLERHTPLHTGRPTYPCPKCPGLGFPLRSQLRIHSRIHLKITKSTETQFSCQHCHKSFDNRWSLTRHLIVHSTDRPHKCPNCDKNYSHRYQLTRHLRKSHGIHKNESGLAPATNADSQLPGAGTPSRNPMQVLSSLAPVVPGGEPDPHEQSSSINDDDISVSAAIK